MKQPERVTIEYVGYKQPDKIEELEFEVLGLKTAIATAQARIASLEQSKQLYIMGYKNEKTVEEGSSDNQAEQEGGAELERPSGEDEGES